MSRLRRPARGERFSGPASVPGWAYPIGAAAVLTTLSGGGFSPGSQTLLIALAAAALLATVLFSGDSIATIEGSPITVVLVLLAVFAALSAVWTIGPPRESLRQALVILAYGAMAYSAGSLASRTGAGAIALGIAAVAALEATIGLGAAALHTLPDAELIGGSWRPGGSFQYPPALGLLEIAALPALLSGLGRKGWVAVAAALGAALAGAVLGSAESRLDLFLAAAVLSVGMLWPMAGGLRRVDAGAGAALLVVAALAGHFVIATAPARTGGGSGDLRLVVIFLICAALAALWLPLRMLARRLRLPARAGIVMVTVAVAAAAVAGIATAGHSGAPSNTRGGLTHGRTREWTAAIDTWLDRPLLGSGASTYAASSVRHQSGSVTRFAFNLPLELAAELGVAGLALGLALYVATAGALVKARLTPALWLLGPGVAAFLAANLVDWSWHLAGLGAVWAVAAGALQTIPARAAHGPRRQPTS